MKNDLDFIRDKIENSGVNAPEDMNEDYVRKTLGNIQPQPAALPAPPQQQSKRKNGWKFALSVTAAVLAIAVGTGVAVSVFRGRLPEIGSLVTGGAATTEELPGGLALKHFGNRQEIVNTIKQIRSERSSSGIGDYLKRGLFANGGAADENYAIAEDAADAFEGGSSKSAASSGKAGSTGSVSQSSRAHSDTYTQVEGVDEADIIKTDGKYIYCIDSSNSREVVIFSAQGKQSRRVAVLDVGEYREATPDEAVPTDDKVLDDEPYWNYYNTSVENIYIRGDRLIVLVNDYREEQMTTAAQVYDISDIGNIKFVGTNTQSGSCCSSRMIGDMLYTVSSYTPYNDRYIPLCYDGVNSKEVPCDCVYALDDPDSESFLVVSAFNIADSTVHSESKAILGSVDDIYCNLNHMYIYTTRWDYGNTPWYKGVAELVTGEDEDDYAPTVTTQVLKVDLTDGIRFTAYAEVDGSVDDQYALDEYDGNLRVATTVSGGSSKQDYNCLYVLDEKLGKRGEVSGFAKGESIKAVRYMGDTAYVITYEETDPLFVIDLSIPDSPKILGEVKISGFSTMLVPIEGDMILGIGYHTENEDYTDLEVQEGLKLALFDVSDKANPKVLDSLSYVDCYSEVQYNPKALVYNPERDDYVIPLNYSHYDYSWYEDDDGYGAPEIKACGGMLNFKVEGGKLREITRYEADYQDDVERCVYVGDTVYMTHHNYSDDNDTLQLDSVKYQ